MAEKKAPVKVKAGDIKKVKANPLTPGEESYLQSKLPEMYTVTQAGEFIKPLENKDTKGEPKLTAEKDVNNRIIVGWGTQAPDLKEGDMVTPADAQERLNVKIRDAIAAIKRNGGETAWNQMSEDEKTSLLGTFHNVGNSGVIFSKKPGESGQYTEFWKAIISGDKEKAAAENDFGDLPGHAERREEENKKAGRKAKQDIEKGAAPVNVDGAN